MKFKISLLLFLIFNFFNSNHIHASGGEGEGDTDGLSCQGAYAYQIGQETEYTFQEGQQQIYIDFTANDDSLDLYLLAGTSSGTDFTLIEIYEKNGCEDPQLIHSQTASFENIVSYLSLTNVEDEGSYLFKGYKGEDLSESQFKLSINKSLQSPCNEPPLTCGELIKNGDFTYANTQAPDPVDAFMQNQVCDWNGIGGNPQLIYRDGSKDNNGPLINDPYAGIWSFIYPFGLYAESISSNVDFESGKTYYLSFTLEESDLVALHRPERFKVWLANQSDIDNISNKSEDLPTLSTKQEVVSMTKNQINSSETTYGYCFTANSNYDRLVFFVEATTQGVQSFIHLDEVSLREITAGEDKERFVSCTQEEAQLGPTCAIPGATYAWSPTTGLSNPNIANPIASPTTTTIYTVSVTLPGGSCIPTDQVTVTVTDPVDYVIPHNTDVAQLRTIVNQPTGNLHHMTFKVNGTLIIDEDLGFYDCSFYMAEDAKILINNNASCVFRNLDTEPEFFKPCNPGDFWDGIYYEGGEEFKLLGYEWTSGFSGNRDKHSFCLFENSKNGVIVKDVSYYLTIGGIYFKNNGRAIRVENTANYTTGTQMFTNLLYLECTQPLSYNGLYPEHAIEIIDLSPKVVQGGGLAGSEIIDIRLSGTAGNLYIENAHDLQIKDSKFFDFNNKYYIPNLPGQAEKNDLAIEVKGDARNPRMSIGNNYFINNYRSINIIGNAQFNVYGNEVNRDENGVIYGEIDNAGFLSALQVQNTHQSNNPASAYPDLNRIKGNNIFNVTRGVQLTNSPYFYVNDNTFDMEVQPAPTAYTENYNEESVAIYANDYVANPPAPSSQSYFLVIEDNEISHSKVGIQTEFIWTEIRNNTIRDLNTRFTVPQSCFPVQNPCPITPAYGIRAMNHYAVVQENKVEIDLSRYSGTAPNTMEEVVGISLENVNAIGYLGASVNCNKVEKTGIGLRFAGDNGVTHVYNNKMQTNKIGFALDNEAYIGDVGTFSSSNLDAGNEWTGSFSGSHTFNFSNDDPLNPPKYYKSSGSNLVISPNHAAINFLPIEDIVTSNSNAISCTAPLLVGRADNGKVKQASKLQRNKSNAKPRWQQKGRASDSAFYLRQQLQFYHINRDSVLYHNPQYQLFRDSMKNTPLGKALGKNSQAIASGGLTKFDQNVMTIESLVAKYFADSILSQAELNQLRQLAVLCPFTEGIAVYQARRVLHQYGERFYVNSCEISRLSPGKGQKRLKSIDQEQAEFDLLLYPNPAHDQLMVSFATEKAGDYRLEMRDVVGKKVSEMRLSPNNPHQINVSQMQSGVYFYRLFEDNEVVKTGKVVIQ